MFIDYDEIKNIGAIELNVLFKLVWECDVLGTLSSNRVGKVCEITGLNKYQARKVLAKLREQGLIEFMGHSGLMINPNVIGTTTKKYFMKERGELWAQLTKE